MSEETKQEETKEPSPVEQAAQKFSNTLPTFKNMIASTKSRKSLVRLINELAEFPLGPRPPRLLSEQERVLFWLFQELAQVKGIVLADITKNMMKKEGEKENGSDTKA